MEWRKRQLWWCVILTWLWSGLAAWSDPPGKTFVEQAYELAKARYQTNSSDPEAAWQFARACFDRADNAGKESVRAATAREGMAACEQALRLKPHLAAAHYYLGMNQGQLAQTKTFGALALVKEMERAWRKARELDEHFDFAGPDRNLAMLYRDAPRAPLSVGHRAKAEELALRAVALAPEYPENHLVLLESYLKWDRWAAAATADEKLKGMMPAARKQFVGPEWQDDWNDWDRRQAAAEKKLRSALERGK